MIKTEEKQDMAYWKDQLERIRLIESQDNVELEKLQKRLEQIRQEIAQHLNQERLEEEEADPILRQQLEVEAAEARERINQIDANQSDLQERKRTADLKYKKAFVREGKQRLKDIEAESSEKFSSIKADVAQIKLKQRHRELFELLQAGDDLAAEVNKAISIIGEGRAVPDRLPRPARMDSPHFFDDVATGS